MLRASVIIPAYNNINTIEGLIRSLENQSMNSSEYEVIAVDGTSSDGTREYLESIKFEGNFRLIKQEKNLGIGSARNCGIKAAESEITLFIDGDMVVEHDWVEKHIKPIEHLDWDGSVGYVQHRPENRDLFIRYLDRPKRGAKKFGVNQQLSHSHFVFWNTSIRKELLTRVGGFDEKINLWGGEELELVVRIEQEADINLRYNPEARATHHQHRTLEDTFDLLEKFGANVVPYIVARHPDLAREFHTRWLDNPFIRKALMITALNPIFFNMIKSIYKLVPERLTFLAIKYMLVTSVMKGYISRPKDAAR